jgi:cell wall-associated NlpC family hydrolase/prophage tail gpP-like protein
VAKQTNPSITNVRALVTTKWGNTGYRPLTVKNIESYYVDTALDNDADAWQIDIGDLNGDYMEVFRRDSEVRVQLFGYSAIGSDYIMTGIADNIEYSEEGTLSLTGRDLSAIATDTILPPTQMRHARAHTIVKTQATRLGFKKTNLAYANQSFKKQYTDGSESYWEFWYRLYRKEKKWIWTEPDGTLVANVLSYDARPSYFFGIPSQNDSPKIRKMYLPIEHAGFVKNTTKRLGHVWVYGHHGDNGFVVMQEDTHTSGWMKRPLKIMLDTDAITPKSATKMAWEEIFEGKVGELELRLTVVDPGYEIHQNRTAVVRIPELDYANTMFVVGVRRSGGRDGVTLEVRLREKNYAISRRVPTDPKLPETPSKNVAATVGDTLQGVLPNHQEWAPFFVKAAQKFHGPWDYTIFLATLIAICDQETGGSFVNVRRNGGPGGSGIEWYAFTGNSSESPNRPASPRDEHGRTLEEWRTLFANVKGQYVNEDYAVGPMQLLSSGYKFYADDLQKAGFHDQFNGGRWNPEYNIMGGGYALRDKCKAIGDTGRTQDLWAAVGNYGEGAKYEQSVKSKVYNTYLSQVQDALKAAQEAAKAARDSATDGTSSGSTSTETFPSGLPSKAQILAFYSTYNPNLADVFQKRMAIQYCAVWGCYHEGDMEYVHTWSPKINARLSDDDPPPNVPGFTDCSGFAHWCYKSAGAPDPGTWTGPQWTSGNKISAAQLQVGDLVFYNGTVVPGHVAVYIGGGNVATFGTEPGPVIKPVKYWSALAGYRSYMA